MKIFVEYNYLKKVLNPNIKARKNREEAKAVQQQWGEEEAALTERGRWETFDQIGLMQSLAFL